MSSRINLAHLPNNPWIATRTQPLCFRCSFVIITSTLQSTLALASGGAITSTFGGNPAIIVKNRRLWLGQAALLTAIVAVWLMQARMSGPDLNASGPTSSSSGGGNSGVHPSILNVSGGETNSKKQVLPAKADGFALPSKAEVTANPDGSVTIPAQLVSRIQFYPLNPDLSVDSSEMKLMGLSEEASRKLEDYVMSLALEEIDREAKNYKVLSQGDDEITLKVSANPSSVNRGMAKMHDSLNSIANEKAALLESSLYSTLSHLTAGFGEHDKVIASSSKSVGETGS